MVVVVAEPAGNGVDDEVEEEVAIDDEDVAGMRGGGEMEEPLDDDDVITFGCLDEFTLNDGLIADWRFDAIIASMLDWL